MSVRARMVRQLSIYSLLLAWFCANGAMLELVQCAAWAKMFASYVPHMSVEAALDETLDPTKPCPICTTVAKARGAEAPTHAEVTPLAEKILLVCQPIPRFCVPFSRPAWPVACDAYAVRRTDRVPVPPPRAGDFRVLV